MQILLVRHAHAGDKAAWKAAGRDDRLRPLTPSGRRKMRRAAKRIGAILETIDVLAASPLARARQTADILARFYPDAKRVETETLSPGARIPSALNWLRKQRPSQRIALVGHEPDLGKLLCRLLAGKGRSFIELKKGGSALVVFPRGPKAGAGMLKWLAQGVWAS